MDEYGILGTDYETVETLFEITGLKNRQSLNYREKKLKERGNEVKKIYDSSRKTVYLRIEADKLINYESDPYQYPKNRKETPGARKRNKAS